MSAGRDAENRTLRVYPLKPFTRDEAVKVVAFGLHRPGRVFDDVAGMRAGFVILGIMTAALVLLGLAVVGVASLWRAG